MIPVHLQSVPHYHDVPHRLPALLQSILPDLRGRTVLIKPNFVAARNVALSCTHPQVIATTARYCLDCGARPIVGDSPAFGTAGSVAAACGLNHLLAPLQVPVITLNAGVDTSVAGLTIPVSRHALTADLIINLPRFKAHSQMRFTGAVKNLFGCICGVHKAWLHARHGDRQDRFREIICSLPTLLPPTFSVMDGIRAMHRTGPIQGDGFDLGLLGACASTVALDTAMGMVLGLQADELPVWRQCVAHGMTGADVRELTFPACSPSDFDMTGFVLPRTLKPESFRPDVLFRSLLKRLWLTATGR